MKTIESRWLQERCIRIDHPSGLPIFVWPKEGYQSAYAVFATRYGSVDTAFTVRMDGEDKTVEVPAGIAHYLEHKLFENEDCDAFERYARTGASANAYTSFNQTAYLFSCTEKVEESLEILLDFVQKPYFTEETVAKEQGIIGQEIRMCEDSPSRRCLFNLLRALYREHPVKIDIAGTVESIAQITPELLYGCYYTFYNLHNMVLVVVGNVTPEQVLQVADRVLQPAEDWHLSRPGVVEPAGAVTDRVEETMPVAAPLFYLGYKEEIPPDEAGRYRTAEELAAAEVLLDIVAGRASPLYTRLMEAGLINPQFGADYFDGPGYGVWMFAGESKDPDAVRAAIEEELARLRQEGIDPDAFEAAKNALYGRLVMACNDVDSCGDFLVSDYFYGREPFSLIDAAASLAVQSVQALLHGGLRRESSALSIVRGS